MAALVVMGLLTVYSASFAIGYQAFGDVHYFVARQALWAGIGLVLMLLLMRVDYHLLRPLSPALLGLVLAALVLVLLPGIGLERNGASRWLPLGPLPPLQPSEFAKLAVIIYMAAWLAAKGDHIKRFSLGLFPFIFIMGIIGWLVMREPDMGTTVILLLIATTIFFVSGAPLSHLALLVVGGGLVMAAMVFAEGYRMQRIASFVSPEDDPLGTGFHVLQLLIALGSGGVTGLGWGASRQKFFYIPGAHTDGVFAIIGEEVGFIGAMVVLAAFVFLTYRCFRVAAHARDQFGTLLALGMACWIAYQGLINVAGVTRSLPMTGVPLPFISYGGSALAALMTGMGVLLSVSRYRVDNGYLERQGVHWRPAMRKAPG